MSLTNPISEYTTQGKRREKRRRRSSEVTRTEFLFWDASARGLDWSEGREGKRGKERKKETERKRRIRCIGKRIDGLATSNDEMVANS